MNRFQAGMSLDILLYKCMFTFSDCPLSLCHVGGYLCFPVCVYVPACLCVCLFVPLSLPLSISACLARFTHALPFLNLCISHPTS